MIRTVRLSGNAEPEDVRMGHARGRVNHSKKIFDTRSEE
jgi:hypothetical protein